MEDAFKMKKYKEQPYERIYTIIIGLFTFFIIISVGFVVMYQYSDIQPQYDKFSIDCWQNNGTLLSRECHCWVVCPESFKCGDWCIYKDGIEVKFSYNKTLGKAE